MSGSAPARSHRYPVVVAFQALGGALAATALFVWIGMRGEFSGLLSDAAVYLLLADDLSPYAENGADLGGYLLGRYPFPPFYPLVLALLGGGSEQPGQTYLIGAAMLGATLGWFYLWLRRLPLSAFQAAALVLLTALLPGTLFVAMGVLSEQLYVLLTLAAVVFLGGGGDAGVRWHRGALLVGLSAITRSAGISAVAALVVFWALRTRGRSARLAPVLAVAPMVLWDLVKRYRGNGTGYTDSLLRDSMAETVAATIRAVSINAHALSDHALRFFDLGGTNHAKWVVGVLAVVAVVGFTKRLRRCEFDAFYVFLYLVMVMLWPYPNHMQRFLFPVLPFLLAYGVTGLCVVVGRLKGSALTGLLPYVYVLLMALVIAPSVARILGQLAEYGATYATAVRTPQWHFAVSISEAVAAAGMVRDIHASMRVARSLVPQDACVTAAEPPYIHLFARRRSIRPAPASATDAEFDALVSECPYVFMMAAESHPATGIAAMYPFHRIRTRMKVLHVRRSDPDNDQSAVVAMLARMTAP